jgi:3'-phosphoadenosine 5'-phosphosulfate sulfotransferase (PAPS reductase)/FAD synthetase
MKTNETTLSTPLPELNITPEIRALIDAGALFVINDSAGKDSQAMKIKLIEAIPARQLVIVHANLPLVEWDGNLEHIRKYSGGIPVYEVQSKKTFFDMVEHRQKFPSPSQRQCTSDLKRNPIQKFINNFAKDNGFSIVVNCLGLRGQESAARAKKIVFQSKPSLSSRARAQYEWLPIHDFKIGHVFRTIEAAGQEPHYAYGKGMSRLSCVFCIMSNDSDLKIAAKAKPELAAKYIALEEKLNFTMSMSRRPLKDIINS